MAKKQGGKRRNSASIEMMLYTSTLLVFLALITAVLIIRPSAQTIAAVPEAIDSAPVDVGTAPDPQSLPAAAFPSSISAVDPGKTPVQPKISRGILVFVIDDVGNNIWQLEPFLKVPGPLTFAVLPDVPYSKKSSEMITDAGQELILHLPMEAINHLNAGPGAINIGMGESEMRAIFRADLAQVPGAVGVNNHMGSKATTDVRTMSIVLDEAQRKGMYFLDSLTIGGSVVQSVANKLKLPAWERTVFLDNTPDRASILAHVAEGEKIARKRGYAIMIGHVWSAELAQTLTDIFPQLLDQGFTLSTISRMIMEKDDEDTGH